MKCAYCEERDAQFWVPGPDIPICRECSMTRDMWVTELQLPIHRITNGEIVRLLNLSEINEYLENIRLYKDVCRGGSVIPGERFRDTMTLVRRDRIRGGYRYTFKDKDGYRWFQDVADSQKVGTFGDKKREKVLVLA